MPSLLIMLSATAIGSGTVLAFTIPLHHQQSLVDTLPHIHSNKNFLHERRSILKLHSSINSSSSSDNVSHDHHASSSTTTPSFEDLGLSSDLLSVTPRMNWNIPTPVQQLAIPAILFDMNENDESSSSLWCEAPTGR